MSTVRQASGRFVFAGADISKSMQPYLLSATYTDNEEDEADDLQIRLQDRDGIWHEKWLADLIEAAASSSTGAPEMAAGEVADSGSTHTVVKGDTLWDIARKYLGEGKRYPEIYELNKDIVKNPNLIYPGQVLKLPGGEQEEAAPLKSNLKIKATITLESGGRSRSLNCGQFELDSVDASGPPSIIVIKATALPFSSQVRQTKKSREWEAYTLSGIAKEIAATAGMSCMYECEEDPSYERVEQHKASDIEFLSELCHDAGISLKATDNLIVLFDQATYEKKAPVLTVRRESGAYTKYKLSTGTADTEYASCRVSYTDPATGKCIEGIAKVEDYDSKASNNQQLEITAKVASIAEAQALAAKRLRMHNKFSKKASFTFPGDPGLVAGVTVMLRGFGPWNGKYIIKQAVHSIDGSGGYTVQTNLRRVLEGY